MLWNSKLALGVAMLATVAHGAVEKNVVKHAAAVAATSAPAAASSAAASSAPASSAPASSAAAAASSAPAAASSVVAGSASTWPTTTPGQYKIPSIPQTQVHDPATECTYYQSEFTFPKGEYPTNWLVATSGTNTTAEFQQLYNSIDWTKVPNIAPNKLDANGALVMTSYNVAQDPYCWWSASGCTKPKAANINPDIYQCPEPETWGLTFDDGPNCSHNAFYDYLLQQNQKASMFYIGSNVQNWPYGAVRGLQDGHHLSIHTWSHMLMTTLTNQEVLAELYYTKKIIKYVTGVTPLFWRPAFGDIDDRVRAIATQLNLTAIIWNLDTVDWNVQPVGRLTSAQIEGNYQNFFNMGTNGTFANIGNIVLQHEINNYTMQMAIDNLPKIKAAYKNVVDVATCMNITHPYVEGSVSVIPFNGDANSANQTGTTIVNGTIVPAASNAKSGSSSITSAASSVSVNFGLVLVLLAALVNL
jgi:peptidoglycan/xylan/chitin deacetylase (PgdA/CDA1 family)